MLIEKKIQIGETTKTKTDIIVSGATYENGVVTITAPNHNILPGTDVYFERPCGDGDVFLKKFSVYDVVDKNTFRIMYDIDNYQLSPSFMRKGTEIIEVSGEPQEFLIVTFGDEHKHICCKDRSGVILRDFYDSDYTFREPVETCMRQYEVLFNNITCYHTGTIDEDGHRVFDEPMLNITDHYVWYIDDLSGRTGMGGAFVPFSPNGYDNRNVMYLSWRNEYENFVSKPLFCFDCRFFNLDGISALTEEITLEFAQGTKVYMYPSSLNIQFGLSDEFRLDLVHEDDVEQYIVERQQAKVSDIIDFEKRMFEPLYKSIRFNIFLRDREYNTETGEWNTSDDKYWFSLTKSASEAVFKTTLKNSDKGDLLGSLGFTDEDVYNQTERLNKTFIRLSFYDSTDRATQTLLYYSTMFMNTSKLHAKYMRNVASNVIPKDNLYGETPEYVRTANDNDNLALCCNFTAYDKFNMSGSSEGFYIYLFPDIVEGLNETEIYMKVELNHAKYGNTIPLISLSSDGAGGGKPRLNYLKWYENSNRTGYLIDLPSLYNDMYIKIKVRRDSENNRYVWYIGNDEGKPINAGSNLVFNLYEPRINDKKPRT